MYSKHLADNGELLPHVLLGAFAFRLEQAIEKSLKGQAGDMPDDTPAKVLSYLVLGIGNVCQFRSRIVTR